MIKKKYLAIGIILILLLAAIIAIIALLAQPASFTGSFQTKGGSLQHHYFSELNITFNDNGEIFYASNPDNFACISNYFNNRLFIKCESPLYTGILREGNRS